MLSKNAGQTVAPMVAKKSPALQEAAACSTPPNPGTLIGLHLDENRIGYWVEFTAVCVFQPASSPQAAFEIVTLASMALGGAK